MSDGMAIDEAAHSRSATQLKQIAHLLGQTEDIFSNQQMASNDYSNAFELMQLWDGIKSAADRQKLLNFARTLGTGRKQAP